MSAPVPSLKEKILDAAFELLRNGGLKKFGQTQIAKAAGIPQGHLTYYFPRKADLVLAVARRSIELVEAALEAAEKEFVDPEQLRTSLAPLAVGVITDYERTRMLLGLLVESDENDALRVLLAQNATATKRLTARAFGLAPDGLEAELAMAALRGLGLQSFLERDGTRTEALVENLGGWIDRLRPPKSGA